MITPISNTGLNFKGKVSYIDKEAAAKSIASIPKEYQNALIDGLNRLKTNIEHDTTDEADYVLDVYDYKQYDRNLRESKGVVVGIGNRKDQPKYKCCFPPEYFYAKKIDMSDLRYADYVHYDIDTAMAEIQDEAVFNNEKEGFERLKSFFTKKRPKPINTDGTKEDILNKLV